MSTNGIHPQIFSLLRLKDEGRALMLAGKYEEAVKTMYYLYLEIEVEDRDKDLFKKINSEIITLDNFTYPGGRTKRTNTMKQMYKTWWEKILITLRTKGYLTNAKYGHYDPAKGRKSE